MNFSNTKEYANFFQQMLDIIPSPLFYKDIEGRYQGCNIAFERFAGKSKGEIVGKTPEELFPPEQARIFRETDDSILRTMRKKIFETTMPRLDGTITRVVITKGAFTDIQGEIAGTLGIMLDITGQMETLDALHHRIDMEKVVSGISAGFITLDSDHIDIGINDALERIGKISDVDRSYVSLFSDDHSFVANTHEWCGDGVVSRIEELTSMPISSLPWFQKKLRTEKFIHIPHVVRLPEEASAEKAYFTSENLGSVVIVPMMSIHDVMGFVGFESIGREKSWDEEDINLLYVLTQSIGSLLERKTVEERMIRSERQYRDLVENINDAVFAIGVTGEITYISPVIESILGISPSDLTGNSFLDLVAPEDRPAVRGSISEILDGGALKPLNFRALQKDGAMKWVRISSRPVYLESIIISLQGVMTDIDRSIHAEEERKRLVTALEQTGGIIFITDPEGTIQYVNRAFETVTGYNRAEVIGQNPRLLKSGKHDERYYRKLWETIKNGEVWTGRLINKKKDGTIYYEDATISPVKDVSGNIINFVAAKRDITHQLEMEIQLDQAQKLEAIGGLAAGIAHEINTPTQFIGDNIRFLKDGYADISRLIAAYENVAHAAQSGTILPVAIDELAQTVKDVDVEFLYKEIPLAIDQSLEGVARVTNIVQAMKEFSHPDSGEKTPVNLNAAIDNTIAVARNEWKYVADVETEYDHELPPVLCLQNEFKQVILNLIINAAHAIEDVVGKNSGKKGTIRIATGQRNGWAEVRVIDTGGGIPENIRSKVFNPFFTTKEVGRGTGQGLAIAYNIITDKHKGSISFTTEVGKGTTFLIRLPLDENKKADKE